MKKKILIPSAMLVAGLTLGGYAMANQPAKPIKQDTQPVTTTNTESLTVGDPLVPATPATVAPPVTDPVTDPAPVTSDVVTPAAAPVIVPAAPAPQSSPVIPSGPVDTSKPGTYNQVSKTISY